MVTSIQGLGGMQSMGGMSAPQSLTAEQKQTLQEILSKYDSTQLTATDAKAMFKSLREEGIRGPEVRQAIQDAGFNADEVWSLANDGKQPPVGGKPPMAGGPRGASPAGGAQSSSKVDSASLQALQTILDQYDLSNLTEDDEQTLYSQLNKTGLFQSGSVIDLSV